MIVAFERHSAAILAVLEGLEDSFSCLIIKMFRDELISGNWLHTQYLCIRRHLIQCEDIMFTVYFDLREDVLCLSIQEPLEQSG